MLKGPSGADLNKETADGFLEHTHIHTHTLTVRENGNGFALGASGGQYDAGLQSQIFPDPL